MMREARELGYRVDFVFIALDAPEMHVLRVATRVEEGGHDIPTDLVLARYVVSTGVRLGQGYDAADTFRLLTSSAPGSFTSSLWPSAVRRRTSPTRSQRGPCAV